METKATTKQEEMYYDIVRLIAEIAREGFSIDVINNSFFSDIFRKQLEIHHNKIVGFINKYTVEAPVPKQEPIQQTQPVNESLIVPLSE